MLFIVMFVQGVRKKAKNFIYIKEGKTQKIKARSNLLRGFIIIVAISLWEFSKRNPGWGQLILLVAVIIIWFLFRIIDEINDRRS